ncbi:L,D-transpeptidase family protein [Pseudomonas sp. UBA6310]|uniref:L,D-transpeptidase family protein n=1 Tax=Pseudomonas sp. UBA6310 TaxID=1947327 RepID=UPI00258053CB|nr:L,D-transpeptidase family protein [Pseudomonas sp. UBA6310]
MLNKRTLGLVGLALAAPLASAQDVLVNPIQQQLADTRFGCVQPAPALSEVDREWLQAFYLQRGFQPAWTDERLQRLFTQLDDLADDGLDPQAYQVHPLRQLAQFEQPSPQLSACTEVLASSAYLQALRHLAFGRLEQAKVEPMWQPEGSQPTLDRGPLLHLAEDHLSDPALAFAEARPATEAYQKLRLRYAELRRQPLPSWLAVPAGPLLKPGAVDARVPLLEQRLLLRGDLAQGVPPAEAGQGAVYSPELVAAVEAFQGRHLLKQDGVIGPSTLTELNRSASERMDQIRVNLERLRWLAHQLSPTGVLVDVAGSEVAFYRDDKLVWRARTQVGRPSRPTPLLRSQITHLTLNPTWTVPPTILREDKLPELQRDAAGYLASNNMQVIDYDGNAVDPRGVDWTHPGRILIRQEPGPHNALGRVAIRFPNPFSVYLHDTPSQRLFDNLPRTFSSGCVRVERVSELIDQLLAEVTPRERERIARLWETGRTLRADLPKPVPILMAYWTAQVGDDGQLQFRPDMYGYDARVLAALNAAGKRG